MLYILIAILMFGILIALHEFGHFAAAKLCGVKVNEFAIGMGPQVIHKKGKETDYSFRLFPIGGFCAMEGEEEGKSNDPRAFPNRPWWQRLIILLAGVFMNFLTGLVIILLLFSQAKSFVAPVVTGYLSGAEDLAAEGLLLGDRLYRVDGHRIYTNSDALLFLGRAGETVDLEVVRDGTHVTMDDFSMPVRTLTDENGETVQKRGIRIGVEEEAAVGLRLKNAWYQAIDYVRLVWISLGDLITGAVGVRDMSGPVGIVDMVGQVGEAGAAAGGFIGAFLSILEFVAFISINLSVMNLLPIPALDGGQILFMAVNGIYTAFTRKKLNPQYLGYVSAAGFACLMLFMAAVTVSDILKKFGV